MRRFVGDESMKKDIFLQVEKNIDALVDNCVDWTEGAAAKDLQDAREGRLRLKFFEKNIPQEWLGDIRGKKVLCLAGAGGLQAPLLACAGAEVTVVDLSGKMLEKDREVAALENLQIELVKGNMCDLSMFTDGCFDCIINPPSFMYVPEPAVVFGECFRVLKQGGSFIMMAPSPVNYMCDYIEDENGGYYKAVHEIPFCSKEHDDSDWIEYGHSMETYLGGMLAAGFVIDGYMECQLEDITELYFMVKGEKTTK